MRPRPYSIAIFLLTCAAWVSAFAATPVNDNFTNATEIIGSYQYEIGQSTYATAEPGEPSHFGYTARKSLWWTWQAQFSGVAEMKAPMQGVAVYIGDSLTNLTVVATNSAPYYNPVQFQAQEGQRYRIAVDSLYSATYPVEFNETAISFANPPHTGRIPQGVPCLLSLQNTNEMLVPVRAEYFLGTNFIGGVSNAPFALSWVPSSVGTQYLVGRFYNLSDEWQQTHRSAAVVVPSNDWFAYAVEIPAVVTNLYLPGLSNHLASAEIGEPNHSGRVARRSLWWKWTPSRGGTAKAALSSPSVTDPALAVYTGSALADLVPVCATNAVLRDIVFEVQPGRTYYIAADGVMASYYYFILNLSLNPLTFAEPAPSSSFTVGEPVSILVTNHDSDHPIISVSLALLSPPKNLASATYPYRFAWTTNVPGLYRFTAEGFNSLGVKLKTEPLNVYIKPGNDSFTNALDLTNSPTGIASGVSYTTLATSEPGEPVHGTGALGNSTWLRWVSPWTANASFSLNGSSAGAMAAIYRGTALDRLTNVVLAPGMVALEAGATYYIACDSSNPGGSLVRIAIYPRPDNDNFENATPFTGISGTLKGSTMSATVQPGEPFETPGDAASIWWSWTAPAAGTFRLNATSAGTTRARAFYGDALSSLIRVGESLNSQLEPMGFPVVAGRTYSIQFAVSMSETSSLWANYQFTENYPHDFFASRVPLTGTSNYLRVNAELATREAGEPLLDACGTPAGLTLWWTYEAPQKGLLRVSAIGSLPAAVGLFRGDSLDSLTNVVTVCGEAQLAMRAGERVEIAIDITPVSSPSYDLRVFFTPAPLNDDFADSATIGEGAVTLNASCLTASLEPGELVYGTTNYGRSVWYTWRPAQDGHLYAGARGPNFPWPTVTAYKGNSLTNLQRIATWTGSTNLVGMAGESIHLQICAAAEFELILQAASFAGLVNDNFADALVAWWTRGGTRGATLELGEPIHTAGQTRSLWWHFSPGQNGEWRVTTRDSAFEGNFKVVVYTGETLETLLPIASGDKEPTFLGKFGEKYYIAVVPEPGKEGDICVFVAPAGPMNNASIPVPGNLLCEPSFEDTGLQFTCWQLTRPVGGYVYEGGGADGTTWPALGGDVEMSQEVSTTPGLLYTLRFAFRLQGAYVRVLAGDTLLGIAALPNEPGMGNWTWTNYTFTATASKTRVRFHVPGAMTEIDGVSLVCASQPPAIVTQPAGVSTFVHGQAAMVVGATGTLPLAYQWYLGGQALTGQTRRILAFDDVTPTLAGDYRVVITNVYGAVTSAPTTLVVETATTPTLVLQPYSDEVVPGGYFALSAAAVGAAPLDYQWYRDGSEVAMATNRQLVFASFQSTDAGVYSIRVTNSHGQVWSLPAILKAAAVVDGGGVIEFANRFPTNITWNTARILDVDGITPLSGSQYVAQLYAGSALQLLRPVGNPQPFLSGLQAGYLKPVVLALPGVPPHAEAVVQVRAWDAARGVSYEEARALGGKFGKSQVFTAQTGLTNAPGYLTNLTAFTLQSGLPRFVSGRIELLTREDDIPTWSLKGEPGCRYVIERAADDLVWRPLLVLTNATGTASFRDPAPPTGNTFYRARVLD